MCEPKRIRLSRAKGWRLPENAVTVARPTIWGNPFVVGTDGTRKECVGLYALLVGNKFLCLSCKAPIDSQRATAAMVRARIAELAGRDLACWCSLDGPCHADVLLVMANHSFDEMREGKLLDRFLHAPVENLGNYSAAEQGGRG